MLDEMLLAGELQEPSKKVFHTLWFAFCISFLAASQPVYPAASLMLCSRWLWFLLLRQSVYFFCVFCCPKLCQQDSRYLHLKVSSGSQQ